MAGAPEVEGIRETLRTLKTLDKKLERESRKAMRAAVAPLQSGARSRLVAQPLSGWTSGRYAYDQGAASKGVKVRVGGSASKRKASWPLVTMTQSNAGGSVFDIAGRSSSGKSPQGRAFIAGLNRYGAASRSMWASAEDNLDEVRKGVLEAIEATERTLNSALR